MAEVGNPNIFVACLPIGTDEAKLRSMFVRFGEIISAKVMVDLNTKQKRQHGFVLFKEPQHAAAAVAAYASAPGGIHVSSATYRESAQAPSTPSDCLYVRNLPDNLTPEHLKRVFEAYGTVVDVSIPDSSPTHKGVGFVRFSRVEEAKKALEQAPNSKPFGDDYAIQIRFKESREMRIERRTKTNIAKGAAVPRRSESAAVSVVSPVSFNGSNSSSYRVPPLGESTELPPTYVAYPVPPPQGVPISISSDSIVYTVPCPAPFPPSHPQYPYQYIYPHQPIPVFPPQQPHHQPLSSGIVVRGPEPGFPAAGDLFVTSYPNFQWLEAVLSAWKPAKMLPMEGGGMCVRLFDPKLHLKAAEQLATVISPGDNKPLSVALIEE